MSNLIELSGHFFSDGQQVPFDLVIRMPQQDAASGDYFCRVESQQLFSKCMDVYGVSRNQAVSLAITLLREALTSRLVRDQHMTKDVGGQTDQEKEDERG
jgi:hypothetical protein